MCQPAALEMPEAVKAVQEAVAASTGDTSAEDRASTSATAGISGEMFNVAGCKKVSCKGSQLADQSAVHC